MSNGEWQHGLAAARAELARRADALVIADRAVSGVVSAAFAAATDAIRRIESVQNEIDSMADRDADCPGDGTALQNRERARLLLHRQREVIAIISDARELASSKIVELQRLIEHYQH